MKRRRVPLATVVLWSASIAMGLAVNRAEAHQLLRMNPGVYCGQTLICHE